MELFKDCPRVLLQKLCFTFLIGVGCLVVGAISYIVAQDTVLLALSGFLSIGCVWRSWSLYRMIAGRNYTVSEGVCVGVTTKPMRRYRSVRLMDCVGMEASLLLDKRTRVKIGYCYRIYFKQEQRPSLGSEYLDTALSGDCFLGIEELGEFSASDDSNTALANKNISKVRGISSGEPPVY